MQMGEKPIDVVQPFEVRMETRGDTMFARLMGELDLASQEAFREALAGFPANGESRLVFDLSRLKFMDSTGLRMLLEVHGRSQERGFDVGLVPGPEQVQKVLELTQADKLFEVVDGDA
jgi:anti-sigma B factor antagonist